MASGNTINPYPLSTNGHKEVPIQIPRTNNRENTQQASRNQHSHTSSVKKKGVKDFEFGKTLGEGSYSTVVAARDRSNNREYAAKILDKKHIIKEKKVKYVNIEKNTLNKMNHPGIVRLYYTFQDPDSLYFILDQAKNGELLTFIKKLGSFDINCTQFYAAQIISAIEYMHSQGVIHRDLKPENILLDDKMHIKVTDFGTAKILEQNADGEKDDRANSFVGTAEYVSPELLKEKAACKSSDFWALGCIIYQLIAGRPPFKGTNEYMTFQRIVHLDYSFPEGFPPVARDLVQKLLVLNPLERLGSGGQVGIDQLKAHPFFNGIDWDALWQHPAPRLLPYLPPNPQHNDPELRTTTNTYLRKLSGRSGETCSSPIATGLKQNDPFRLESWAGGDDASDKVDPEKFKKLEEQKRTSSQW
ncbi:6542_t:CDS:2 [Funneliformis geosporum]|uniref:non-specific serine/threonine protein kinase n=1 Tax=Funneliformis geosporum TaxID=1117311 RepID=A0A9W4WU30_9GLOM|nr:6542_t:CDS:2 [Funneliformis geosporum]CAI2163656.1 19015_t:CDS:2 [Funneliformis geosporum]